VPLLLPAGDVVGADVVLPGPVGEPGVVAPGGAEVRGDAGVRGDVDVRGDVEVPAVAWTDAWKEQPPTHVTARRSTVVPTVARVIPGR